VKRLLTGELPQGALAGLMVDPVAEAAGVPGALVRRAPMLSDDLTRTAAVALAEGEEGFAGSAASCPADPSDARLHGGGLGRGGRCGRRLNTDPLSPVEN
jgi:DNA ligase-1